MKTFALTLLIGFFTLTNLTAEARWKDTSGGNGIGGTLLDQYEKGMSEELKGEEILKILNMSFRSRLKEMPLLHRYAEEITVSRKNRLSWYLEERKLSKDCFNQSALDLPEQTILACQNDVEVRINRTWWLAATIEQRANLLAHELITSMALERGTTRGIRESTAAFLDASKSNHEVSETLVNAGFPLVPSLHQTRAILNLMAKVERETCALKNEREILLKYANAIAEFQGTDGYELAALSVQAIDLQLKEQKSFACKTSLLKPHFELLFQAWKTLVATP